MVSAWQRARIPRRARFGNRLIPPFIAVLAMIPMLWSEVAFCQTPPSDPASPPPASVPVKLTAEQKSELQARNS